MHLRIIAIFLLLSPGMLSAQDYGWPTNASHYLTSSFGEFRPRHFHAGLDIKTWNQSGYKIFAIDDGYIWRIRTSNTGYGKVLYQKLSDGRIAVYAHLDRFADPIDEYVYQLHQQTGKYSLDQFPEPKKFPVQKGDIIAYSGNTGTRYPHLHFEIRSANNEPMNPLRFGFKIKDEVPPTPQSIALAPLDRTTLINGNPWPVCLPIDYMGQNTFRTNPITVTGAFGVELQAYDGVSDVYNKYSVYAAELTFGDSTLFRFQYDQFKFNHSPLITVERNYGFERENRGRFQRLYKTAFTSHLPFYPKTEHGRVQLPLGEHELRLVLRDFNGNSTTVIIPVEITNKSLPTVKWEYTDSLLVCRVNGTDSTTLAASRFVGINDTTRTSVLPDTTITAASIQRIYFNKPHSQFSAFEFRYSTGESETVFPFSMDTGTVKVKDIHWEFSQLGMAAVVRTKSAPAQQLFLAALSTSKDTIIPLYSHNLLRWHTLWIPTDVLRESVIFVLQGRRDIIQRVSPGAVVASVTGETIARTPDNLAELHLSPQTLYYPSLIWTSRQETTSPNLSPTWSFFPRTAPFRSPGQLRVRLPDTLNLRRQIGIYYSEGNEEWNYLPAEFSADSTNLIGEILSLESFTLRRDSIPPTISDIRPAQSTVVSGEGLYSITSQVDDELSGIPGEQSIQLLLDGNPVIFEFNPATKQLKYRIRQPLAHSPHTVEILARDAAGNTAHQTSTFTVQ